MCQDEIYLKSLASKRQIRIIVTSLSLKGTLSEGLKNTTLFFFYFYLAKCQDPHR